MVIRIFKCGVCGHRMRVGQARCGYCHSKRPLHRKLWPYGTAAVIAAAVAATSYLPALQADAGRPTAAAAVLLAAD